MNIGNKVKIIDIGYIYSTFTDMAKLLNATNWKYDFGKLGDRIENGDIGTIRNLHSRQQILLVDHHKTKLQFLIGFSGVRITETEFFGEEWDKLIADIQ